MTIGDRDYLKRFFSGTADGVAEIRAELLEIAELYDKNDGADLSVQGSISRIRDVVSKLALSVHELHEEALDSSRPKATGRK